MRSQTISFDAGDKNIEIDFSSLNYAFPDKIKYAYKMEGVDDDWVYVRGDRQFAFYNQLPKGKRTFYLKTTDTNGLWSNYIAEIQVSKEPAFYETWWAYMFYVVLVILSLYLFYRFSYSLCSYGLTMQHSLIFPLHSPRFFPITVFQKTLPYFLLHLLQAV